MAVISHKRAMNRGGSLRSNSYTASYHVFCSLEADDEQVIDYYFRDTPSLPWWNRKYRRNLELRDWLAVCTDLKIDFVRVGKEGGADFWQWRVVAEFTPLGKNRVELHYKQLDANLNMPTTDPWATTENPNFWQPKYDSSFKRREVDDLFGRLNGILQSDGATFQRITTDPRYPPNMGPQSGITDDDFLTAQQVISNSAREPVDPPYQGELFDRVIKITNWTGGFGPGTEDATDYWNPQDKFDFMIGGVNSKTIWHWDPEAGKGWIDNGAVGAAIQFKPYELKLTDIASELMMINGMMYYENVWSFSHRRNSMLAQYDDQSNTVDLGWREIRPDIGRSERDAQGKLVPIKDAEDEPVSAYQKLDGFGKAIPPDADPQNAEKSFWLIWLPMESYDFLEFSGAQDPAQGGSPTEPPLQWLRWSDDWDVVHPRLGVQ